MEKEKKQIDTSDREITIARTFNAPIELVWEVWTNPDHIKNWWGPNGFTNTIEKMEVRPEGKWEFVIHGPDGTDYKNINIYKEIVKHERIVMQHEGSPEFTATITFSAKGDKTHIHWHMLFDTRETFEHVVKTFKADEGLKQNTEKLAVYLNEITEKESRKN
jgi:uncharacterized protein YndB with AHSA1/START domain